LGPDESDQEQQQQNFGGFMEADEEEQEPEDSVNDDPSSPPETSAPAVPTTVPSTSARPRPESSSKRKDDGELKRLIDFNRNDWAEREEKRLKIQGDILVQIAWMQTESQERLMEMRLWREDRRDETQLRREEKRDERRLQMIQSIMTLMVGIVNGTALRPNHPNNNDSP